jgi:hypothetical protein
MGLRVDAIIMPPVQSSDAKLDRPNQARFPAA